MAIETEHNVNIKLQTADEELMRGAIRSETEKPNSGFVLLPGHFAHSFDFAANMLNHLASHTACFVEFFENTLSVSDWAFCKTHKLGARLW